MAIRPLLFFNAVVGFALLVATTGATVNAAAADGLTSLAIAAVSDDDAEAEAARQQLRAYGPAGLDALLTQHAEVLAWQGDGQTPEPALRQRVRAAVDHVAGQRDAHASRLYWHVDLDAALAAAESEGKPVLSLHMLGRLDEEYSCANSRFFRTALYANQPISDHLREHYILHWHSVRPVPRITIDMGDGRRIERTITGNSIHYVLAPDGQVLDAIPGLYGQQAFHSQLHQAHTLYQMYGSENHGDQPVAASALQLLERNLAWQMRRAGIAELAQRDAPQEDVAAAANRLAFSKAIVEMPMLSAMDRKELDVMHSDDPWWEQLAEQAYLAQSKLDDASLALMREKLARRPHVSPAGDSVWHSLGKEIDFDVMVQQFERSMATDTARNQYQLRRTILSWLSDEPGIALTSLNQRVYAELFLTPGNDPWLGLVPEHAYTGLDSDGLMRQTRADH